MEHLVFKEKLVIVLNKSYTKSRGLQYALKEKELKV